MWPDEPNISEEPDKVLPVAQNNKRSYIRLGFKCSSINILISRLRILNRMFATTGDV